MRPAPRSPRRSIRGALRHASIALSAGILDLMLAGALVAAAFVAVTLPDLPDPNVLKNVQLREPLRVYSADGGLMAEFGTERRNPVSFKTIPPLLVSAFLATEDTRFYEHKGIDLKGIGRAAVRLVQTGKRTQGGSTITMQVARNFFLSREKTFQRKLSELLLSLDIERKLTKEEIIELYFNQIFFGHRAYGISAAAALYYDKELDELSIGEMAMLAGLPKAPSAHNPVSNPEQARERRNYILRRMYDLGYITEVEFQTASELTDRARLHGKEVDLQAGYVAEMVRREVIERYGENAYQEGYRVTTTIVPRLQHAAQNAVRKALRAYDRRHGYHGAEAKLKIAGTDDKKLDLLLEATRRLPDLTAGIVVQARAKKRAEVYIGGGDRITLGLDQVKWARPFRNENRKGPVPRRVTDVVAVGDLIRLRQNDRKIWELSQAPTVTGALVALSPMDGAVHALVGGYYFADSKFNRAVDARRQPGSSFKPLVYAAALDQGYTPASLLRDEPISIRVNRNELWEPKNSDRRTMGPIRMRIALTLSRNLASIDLLQRAGLDTARDYIQRFGFTLEELPQGLSIVLGTAEVSPLRMAGAYALFANGGFRITPYFISRIQDSADKVVFEAKPPHACSKCWARYRKSSTPTGKTNGPLAKRVLNPGLVYEMTSMMQDVIKHGTGRKALQLKRKDLAGKTGTTNDVRDSWFCGFQKDLVTITWMGYDKFRPLGKKETGGQAGLGMWVDFMREALKDKPQAILRPPRGMVRVRIAKDTGQRIRSGGLVEWIRRKYAYAPEGPDPVSYFSNEGSAPRVIDDLF